MIRLEDIVIDDEFRDLMPVIEDSAELEAEIEKHGWTDEPITVWEHHGILLDGHRRYAIWKKRGDEGPMVRELSFPNREEAFRWAVHFACARRNLTPEQQKYLLGKKYRAEVNLKGGYENVKAGKEKSKDKNCLSIHSEQQPTVSPKPKTTNPTRERVAEEAGVSPGSVRNAEMFSKAVDALGEAGIATKSELLSGKQKRTKTSVIKAGKLASEGKVEEAKSVFNNRNPPKPKEKDPKARPRPSPASTMRAIDSIKFALSEIEKMNTDLLKGDDYKSTLSGLSSVRARISKIIKSMKEQEEIRNEENKKETEG